MACLGQHLRKVFERNGKGETNVERNDEKTAHQMGCEMNAGEGRKEMNV